MDEEGPTNRRRQLLESSSAVGGLVLGGGDRFVGLPGGPVHCLDPQHPVLLVVTRQHHQVALLDGVEEDAAALQA